MLFLEILQRYYFCRRADRIGPDVPFTHWKLHFRSTMLKLCRSKFAKFGNGSSIRPGAYAIACSKISIGANVTIRPGTMLFADTRAEGRGIEIEDDTLIGSGVHIYTTNHKFTNPNIPIYYQGHSESKEVILKKGCWIGANVTILPGVEIGENTVIGAGSVVTKSIPAGCVAVGNPAKVINFIKNGLQKQ